MGQGVSLKEIVEKMNLKNLTPDVDLVEKYVQVPDINRPALQLSGYFDHFDSDRVQVIGYVEYTYLQTLEEAKKMKMYDELLSHKIPCLIFSRALEPDQELLEKATQADTPVLITQKSTSSFMAELIRWMNVKLAPCISIHGVLVDVYGVGVLIMGESGIGKSEAALELIKRGHRLVTDDVVEIRKVSDDTLVGSAPDITRHFIELRGIGIVDVKSMFGVQSVRETQNIDLVITLEDWSREKEYDRLGLFEATGTILEKWEIKTHTEEEGKAILPDVAASLKEKKAEHDLADSDIIGVGVGVPAPVTEEGIVFGSANLGWKYKEVKKELEELTGLDVEVGNDANVAALGEMWKGGGAGYKNLIMVTLGTGVGGGIIVGGKILTGSHGAGGEIGHLRVNPHETESCGCGGKGCLEQYASATGIVRLAKRKLEQETRNTILNRNDLSAKSVFDAVKADDSVAKEIAESFGNYLGRALANLAAVIDPSIFVIGGGVSKAGEILLEYVEKPFQENAFFANKDVKFALATLGNDAGICGAAKLVLDDFAE